MSKNIELIILDHIENIITEIKKNKNNFSIYGAGDIGRRIQEFLRHLDLKPNLFFDKNLKNKESSGVKILHPEKIKENETKAIIIASIEFDKEIKEYLEEINFKGKVISFKKDGLILSELAKENELTIEYAKICERTRNKSEKYREYEKKQLTTSQIEDVKHIAFYLPQFHKVYENEIWWGKNFTEWQNVTRAVPQYFGQYQPHLPIDTGFYDLANTNVLKEQVLLAKNYGIYGFCFYFYWFNGRRILEKPLNDLLNDKSIDMPFCYFWANESWTRTWQGFSENDKSESRMLIEQNHNDIDDVKIMEYLCQEVFSDNRYIKIKGKPVFILYHTELFESIERTVKTWRDIAKKNGYPDLFLMFIKKTKNEKPDVLNEVFDSALQFLPNDAINIRKQVKLMNPYFQGKTYCYESLLKHETNRTFEYNVARSLFMSWDNEARRPTKGISYVGTSPELFKKHLGALNTYAKQNPLENESIIFINAWNEWAEGAHLEPDREYGYAWLNSLAEIIGSKK